MSASRHHIVIGNGVAGSQAAVTLREREPDSRVTMVTLSSLLFYNRYDLPKVFRGSRDWREFLVYPPQFYTDNRIDVRRATSVKNVDTRRHVLELGHKEEISYDTLLVASGGRSYLPEELSDFRPLLHGFGTYEHAITVARALPEGGHVLMLGGDMIGLDLARTLIDTGYRVSLLVGEYTFWPHEVDERQNAQLIGALERMGVEVIGARGDSSACGVANVEVGAPGMPARKVTLRDGREIHADVVMPFFGLMPSVEFMLGSGVDIERGLLVSPVLATTDHSVYAAGDVCQIWSDADRRYRFFYGWKNVRAMGERAARNITGEAEPFVAAQDETLHVSEDKGIHSPFWEYA